MSVFVGIVIGCDSCGEKFEQRDLNTSIVFTSAKSRGWIHRKNGIYWDWYCPACEVLDAQEAAARLAPAKSGEGAAS